MLVGGSGLPTNLADALVKGSWCFAGSFWLGNIGVGVGVLVSWALNDEKVAVFYSIWIEHASGQKMC